MIDTIEMSLRLFFGVNFKQHDPLDDALEPYAGLLLECGEQESSVRPRPDLRLVK
jgi:hypothetical protein